MNGTLLIHTSKSFKSTPVCQNKGEYVNSKQLFFFFRFIPERWFRESKGNIHPFANLPFSFGPRGCVGRRFAELEIQLLTVKLVQNFKIEWAGERPLEMNWRFVHSPDQPLRLKYTDL